MADNSGVTTDNVVLADRDRVVLDPETGVRRRIFAGTSVPAALAALDDAPDEGTSKAQRAPATDKAQRAPSKDK